jgi:hypothetical protein
MIAYIHMGTDKYKQTEIVAYANIEILVYLGVEADSDRRLNVVHEGKSHTVKSS